MSTSERIGIALGSAALLVAIITAAFGDNLIGKYARDKLPISGDEKLVSADPVNASEKPPSPGSTASPTQLDATPTGQSSAQTQIDSNKTSSSGPVRIGPYPKGTVSVLLVQGNDPAGAKIFAFVVVPVEKLDEFLAAQKEGLFYPGQHGLVVLSGVGEPTDADYEKMYKDYRFNREGMLSIN